MSILMLQKLSSVFGENVQMSRVFGFSGLDPLLVDLFVDGPAASIVSD